jgi:hypothetical protein
MVKSGSFDWVLTEITQASTWKSRSAYANKRVAKLMARDPGFTVNGMEDHASLVFWKLVESIGASRVTSSLRNHVSAETLDWLPRAWTKLERGECFHLEPVVAAVEVEGFDERKGFDRVEVRIRWQLGLKTRLSMPKKLDPVSKGVAMLANAISVVGLKNFNPEVSMEEELASGRDGLEEDRKSIFMFERRVGQETPVDQNLTTTHCPSCGGPETPAMETTCTWCGVELGTQAGAWMLVEILPGHKGLWL